MNTEKNTYPTQDDLLGVSGGVVVSVFESAEQHKEFNNWINRLSSVELSMDGGVLPESIQAQWEKLRPTFTFLGGKAPVKVDCLIVERCLNNVYFVTAMKSHLVVSQPFDVGEVSRLLIEMFKLLDDESIAVRDVATTADRPRSYL